MSTPGIDDPTAAAALHGSYCPKMCSHACPVTAATGRDDAIPWSFHRTVADLADGRLPLVPSVADRLTACSGCLACQVPCVFDQDVPAQVRAGRAALVAADVAPAATRDAIDHVREGRTPSGGPPLAAPADDDRATVRLAVGCRDAADDVQATVTVLRAAGERVAVHVPAGCCGALLADLGAAETAAEARAQLPTDLPVVSADPHCLGAWRDAGADATDLASYLDERVTDGRLRFQPPSEDASPVTWHDPCVLARAEEVVAPPRRVLAAAGLRVQDPEGSGRETVCSGAGLGLDLLDPAAADATAARRTSQLGTGPVVTGCARARDRLAANGADVTDLAAALVARLSDDPRSGT